MRTKILLYTLFSLVLFSACMDKSKQVEYVFEKFLEKETPALEKLMADKELANWNAHAYGSDSAYQEYKIAINDFYKHTDNSTSEEKLEHYEGLFYDYIQDDRKLDFIKKIRESGMIKDPALKQQLEYFYYMYLEGHVHKESLEISELTADLQETYKILVGQCKKPNAHTDSVVATLNIKDKYEKEWVTCHLPGKLLANKIVERAKSANELAKRLGYRNYHHYAISTQQVDYDWLVSFFDSLEVATREPFKKLMQKKLEIAAHRYSIKTSEVRPWHSSMQDKEKLFYKSVYSKLEEKGVTNIMKTYFYNIGLPIEDIIANSDFEEREGKYPYAVMFRISRDDIRLLGHESNTFFGLRESLHLFGHAVYESGSNKNLPLIIATPHVALHEGIAKIFEELAYNPYWLEENVGISADTAKMYFDDDFQQFTELKMARLSLLVFKFEKALYENPDADLNKVWADLYSEIRMISYPDNYDYPDWAYIPQVLNGGCQFYAYQLGRIFAWQLLEQMHNDLENIPASFSDDPRIGKYLQNHLFQFGNSYPLNEMIKNSTGKKLSYKAYIETLR